MLLTRKTETARVVGPRLCRDIGARIATMDRRAFLKRSGMVAGVGAFASQLPYGTMGKAQAADEKSDVKREVHRTVCTHCSVGCSLDAIVENGVWVRQEPVFDSPLNLGAHCAKGASIREHGHGDHRLKTPMKLVNGKYQKITWDQAISELGDKLIQIRKESGPDAVFWVGSSKHSNEQSYLLRKFVSYFGSNNCDHQARICHSTTVSGVANTWGYGAMTNSYNDMQNTKCALYIGSNAAEAHPVSMLHMLHAKETGAKMIVCDPRFTRTAAKADYYVRIRSGTDVAFLFGVLYHIFKNNWQDDKYIHDRVYGMDKVKEDVMAKWTPDKCEEVTGVPEAAVYKVAEMMAKNRPSTLVWCMGQTQHATGNAFVRASCIVQLALGNIGVSGGGANIFRGHDNVQGATDIGPDPDSLPGTTVSPRARGSTSPRCRASTTSWIKGQFASQAMMEKPGMTVSRWIDGVLERNELIDQDSNLRALIFWGHAPNSETRGKEMVEAMKKLDVARRRRPVPVGDRGDGGDGAQGRRVSPAGVHAARDVGQRHRVEPVAAMARACHRTAVRIADRPGDHVRVREEVRLGSAVRQELRSLETRRRREIRGADAGIRAEGDQQGDVDDRLHRPVAREVEAAHEEPEHVRREVAAGAGRPVRRRLLRVAMAVLRHAGDQASGLAQPVRRVEGDDERRRVLRANFGIERDGVSLLGRRRVLPQGLGNHDRIPEFDHVLMKKIGSWDELTDAEKKAAEGKNWKTDLSGGINA